MDNNIFTDINQAICFAEPGTVIFEDIPVGYGKSTNVFNLVPWAIRNEKKIMLVSPRIALCDNLQTMLKSYALDNGYTIEEVEENVKICTLQAIVAQLKRNQHLPKADVVIWDEAQGLATESVILPGSTGIVEKIIANAYSCKNVNVFMSGSGEVFFADFEKRLRSKYIHNGKEILMKEIKKFEVQGDFSYLTPYFFHEETDVINIIRNTAPEEKIMVFVDNISFGEKLLESLQRENISAKFISSRNINTEKVALRQINMLNSFLQKVLVCTSVLMVGISICSPLVKHVVVFPTIKENTIQMTARRRRSRKKTDEKVNVYFCSRKKEYFASLVESELYAVERYEEFRRELANSHEDIIDFLFDNAKRVSDYANCYYKTSAGILFNELGYAEHIRLAKLYKHYCEELEEDEHFFEKEVLNWFGLDSYEISYFSSQYEVQNLKEFSAKVEAQLEKSDQMSVLEGKNFLNSLRPIIRKLDMSYERKQQLMPDDFNEFCKRFNQEFYCDNKGPLEKGKTVYRFVRTNVEMGNEETE